MAMCLSLTRCNGSYSGLESDGKRANLDTCPTPDLAFHAVQAFLSVEAALHCRVQQRAQKDLFFN